MVLFDGAANPRVSKPAFVAQGLIQVILAEFKLRLYDGGDNHLRDAVSTLDRYWFLSEVDQQDFDDASIIAVYCAGRVQAC